MLLTRTIILLAIIMSPIRVLAKSEEEKSRIGKNYQETKVLPYLSNAYKLNTFSYRELLNRSETIIGVEILLADKSDNDFASRWGHVLLRLVDNDDDITNDFIISFNAHVTVNGILVPAEQYNTQIYYELTARDRHPLMLSISTLHDIWSAYLKREHRGIIRYIVPTSDELRISIIRQIGRWHEDPRLTGYYNVLSNNCSKALVRFLKSAGFPSWEHFGLPTIPLNFPEWAENSLLTPYPPLKVPSPKHLLEKAQKILGIPIEEIIAGKWPSRFVPVLASHFSELELKRFIYSLKRITPFLEEGKVLRKRSIRHGISLEKTMGLQTIPSKFYEVCHDLPCAQSILTDEEKTWAKENVQKTRTSRRHHYRQSVCYSKDHTDAGESEFCTVNFNEDIKDFDLEVSVPAPVLTHFQWLLQAQQKLASTYLKIE